MFEILSPQRQDLPAPRAKVSESVLAWALTLAFPALVSAHFQELIPSSDSLSAQTGVTQVIKADGQGVFSYAMPRAGWWGFAALLEGEAPMPSPEGDLVPVEQGALMWVQVRDMR